MYLEPDVPALFSTKEVATILNISKTQLYALLKAHEIDSVQIGHARRVTQNQLIAYIDKLEGKTD